MVDDRSLMDEPLPPGLYIVATPIGGGHVFFSGTCEQDGEPTHSFTGTLKRVKPRQ